MTPSGRLHEYLQQIHRRLKVSAASRGIGATALAALILTVVLVFIANTFAFSDSSVISTRTLLFGSLIAAVVLLLILPLRRLGKGKAARQIEQSVPAFQGRVSTFVDETSRAEQTGRQSSPILELLAEDTMQLAQLAPAESVVSWKRIASYSAGGIAAATILIWLGTAGPGYWGYGTARLWGGWLQPKSSPLYQIVIQPGDATIRQGADLVVKADMVGFQSPSAQLFAKFASSVKWEEAPMQRQLEGSGFEFLFAGVREPFQYYISAGGIRSEEFDVQVVEMPNVRNIKLTYHFPAWTGRKALEENPGGDIRAVAGTEIQVEVETDKPLEAGVLVVNEEPISLQSGGLVNRGTITVKKDGHYFVGAVYRGETVRITEDFLITETPDEKPVVRFLRPGRDSKASSIEEVVTHFEAEDDFALAAFDLHYSVNGGPPKKVSLLKGSRAKADGEHTFYLEEMGQAAEPSGRTNTGGELVPGDLITYYAVARDHQAAAQTDMYFIEVQPFEREYFQVQASGGMQAGGEPQQNEISQRQKMIIAATWNLVQESDSKSGRNQAEVRENSVLLGENQLVLRDMAQTLAERVRARQLDATSKDFAAFVENMEKATEEMAPAAEQLRARQLKGSLPHQQKALQFLLRAEAIFRRIQVTFGNAGGGGGGGEARDLAEMFELEMDLEKNQYETGGGASADQLDREVDEALEKLRELAQRQEKLAEQRRNEPQPTFAQRWQQEMLRREAEELKRRLEELQQRQQSQKQQAGSQQSGRQQSGQQGGSQGSQGSSGGEQSLENTIKQLEQATKDMQASSQSAQQSQGSSGQSQGEASARRAQERLQKALKDLDAERQQQTASSISDIAQRSRQLAEQQAQIAPKLQQALEQALQQMRQNPERRQRLPSGLSREEERALAEQKSGMHEELQALERKMQETIRRLGNEQRKSSSKLREALGDLQQNEVGTRLRVASEYIRQGGAAYVANSEEGVTRGLKQLREQTQEAERLAGVEGNGGEQGLERSLARLEDLRQQLERAAGMGQQPGEEGQGEAGQENQQGQGQQGQEGKGQQGQGQQSGEGRQPGEGQQGQSQQGQGQQGEGRQSGQGSQGQGAQSGGQQGRGQQQGQQQGQQPGEGQQPGQQGRGSPSQQAGSQQSPGGSPGQGMPSGQPQPGGQFSEQWGRGGAEGGSQQWANGANNFGQQRVPGGFRTWDPQTREAMERALREGAGQVPQLTKDLHSRGLYPEDLEEIRRFVRGLPGSRFQGNPKLLEQEYRKMLALLEQLELQVRRQVETGNGTQVRSTVTEPVPEEYREAVAEYFRRLSEGASR